MNIHFRSIRRVLAAALIAGSACATLTASAEASTLVFAPYSSYVRSADSTNGSNGASTVVYAVTTKGGGTINPGGTITLKGTVQDTKADGLCARAYVRTTDFANGGQSVVRRSLLRSACGKGVVSSFAKTFTDADGVIDFVEIQAIRSDGAYSRYSPSIVTGSIID